ncbi:MAG TPA: glycosyltransferase, partial [Planctomycetia bacterium]|nr:glycosyltransferase [Planctomycetia bacterium]
MHALLIPVGSAGDVHPFLGLGRGLLARGHRVTVATNSLFGAVAADLGMEFVEIGTREEFADAMKNPDLWHPTKGFPMIIREALIPLVPRIYEVIQRHYVPGDTFVVAGTLAFGARLAQEKLGVPLAMTHLSPSCLRSIHDFPALPRLSRPDLLPMWLRPWLWKLADLMIDRMMCPGLNAHRAAVGLPPVRRPMHEWMHSPLLTLGLFPDWFAAIQPDWPASMRLAGFPLYDERDAAPMSADVEAFLAAGAPPVAFTPGSAMLEGREFFAASMDACLRAGLRGVLLTRHGEQIPPH